MSTKTEFKNFVSHTGDFFKKHKRGTIVTVAIVLAIALLFTALYFTGVFDDRSKAILEVELPTMSEPVESFGGGYYVEITGKIRNVVRAEIKIVVFRFEFIDADGNVIVGADGRPIYAEDRNCHNLGYQNEYVYHASNILPKVTKFPVTFRPAKGDFVA